MTNNNLVEDKEADGFRKVLAREFNEIWVLDLKGDARSSGERRRREGGNVFLDKIKVGIAITFCVKKKTSRSCKIFYEAVADYSKSDEKLEFVAAKPFAFRNWEEEEPDEAGNWINLGPAEFRGHIPLVSKAVRANTLGSRDAAIFGQYSLGMSTNRDEWVYGSCAQSLNERLNFLSNTYHDCAKRQAYSDKIKWSETLKKKAQAKVGEAFSASRFRTAAYRPFVKRTLYASKLFVDRPGGVESMYPVGARNVSICFSDTGFRSAFCVLSVDGPADLHFGASIDGYQQVSKYWYDSEGARLDNITDWALDQFRGV